MASSSTKDPSPQDFKDLRVVLLGKTGSGKSATGNTILGRQAFKAEISPTPVTKKCQKEISHFDGRTVSIIDTPGIFDTTITAEEFKEEIERCIMLSVPGPHVFLLVIRLDVRYTSEEKNAIKWIKDNFGGEASKYTLVLFTRGDMLGQKTIESFWEENNELRDLIRSCNARYSVFDNTCMQNRTQVNDLFEKIDEIVQLNGQHYTSSIYEAVQKKIKSDEWWDKCGNCMMAVGTSLLTTAAVTVAPAAGAAVVTEEIVYAVGTSVLAAAGGGLQAAGKWMKPKTEDN